MLARRQLRQAYNGDVLWDLEYALQLQQSPTKREPHEDSTTDASDVLTLPNVRRVPSLSESIVVEDSVLNSDSLNISESEVFSQLRIANARSVVDYHRVEGLLAVADWWSSSLLFGLVGRVRGHGFVLRPDLISDRYLLDVGSTCPNLAWFGHFH
ncbi:hypothetical protein EZV62_027945 [Acer yangbiense]|uniref:Uncharacterized protein n=1 Tax=Acer yangbiense TaxID=1000413 RepID=A0A5C7GPQ3_9ROSI|nr:hypothetical protein EZV62_027945 [Acer yangbiense]